jgi:hypothetical protein
MKKIGVYWDVSPNGQFKISGHLKKVYVNHSLKCAFQVQVLLDPDNEGATLLRKVGMLAVSD